MYPPELAGCEANQSGSSWKWTRHPRQSGEHWPWPLFWASANSAARFAFGSVLRSRRRQSHHLSPTPRTCRLAARWRSPPTRCPNAGPNGERATIGIHNTHPHRGVMPGPLRSSRLSTVRSCRGSRPGITPRTAAGPHRSRDAIPIRAGETSGGNPVEGTVTAGFLDPKQMADFFGLAVPRVATKHLYRHCASQLSPKNSIGLLGCWASARQCTRSEER